MRRSAKKGYEAGNQAGSCHKRHDGNKLARPQDNAFGTPRKNSSESPHQRESAQHGEERPNDVGQKTVGGNCVVAAKSNEERDEAERNRKASAEASAQPPDF